jgi:hypothetical protein
MGINMHVKSIMYKKYHRVQKSDVQVFGNRTGHGGREREREM